MKVVKIAEEDVLYDEDIIKCMDNVKKLIRDDWWFCYLIDGKEGSGKSVLAQQLAAYLDDDFYKGWRQKIAFNGREFYQCIKDAEKYSCVIFDEAFNGLCNRTAMNKENIIINKLLQQCRQRNLFVFIVLPKFFELDRGIVLGRANGLFHCLTTRDKKRGYYHFYGDDKKRMLYFYGKQLYEYKVKPDIYGRFTGKYIIKEKAYREMKTKAFEILNFDDNEKEEKL